MTKLRFAMQGGGKPPFGEPVVFLPGWGFDGRIVRLIEPPAGFWAPEGFLDPAQVAPALEHLMAENGWPRVTLVGWSMGAHLACDYAAQKPERVAGLWLLAMRRAWPEEDLTAIRAGLAASRDEFLRAFYRKCFLGRRRQYQLFADQLEDDYIARLPDDVLARGLAYLGHHDGGKELSRPELAGLRQRTVLVHGRRDVISPVGERAEIPGGLSLVLEDHGHALFLVPDLLKQADRQAVRGRFDAAARTYDRHADVQKEAASALALTLPEADGIGSILEIGCGTGNLTLALAGRYPEAAILALDFAPAMIDVAREKMPAGAKVSFLCRDAEVFVREDERQYDLVASNATLQWFGEIDRAFAAISERLRPGGFFCFSIFGPGSLIELAAALAEAHGGAIRLPSEDFPAYAEIAAILGRHFSVVDGREISRRREYPSFKSLLDQLRKTGTTGPARRRAIFTKERLRRIEDWFYEHHGGFVSSYQIFLFRCVK